MQLYWSPNRASNWQDFSASQNQAHLYILTWVSLEANKIVELEFIKEKSL
jgi:hypothetical protein